jgi:hypothetical protein
VDPKTVAGEPGDARDTEGRSRTGTDSSLMQQRDTQPSTRLTVAGRPQQLPRCDLADSSISRIATLGASRSRRSLPGECSSEQDDGRARRPSAPSRAKSGTRHFERGPPNRPVRGRHVPAGRRWWPFSMRRRSRARRERHFASSSRSTPAGLGLGGTVGRFDINRIVELRDDGPVRGDFTGRGVLAGRLEPQRPSEQGRNG